MDNHSVDPPQDHSGDESNEKRSPGQDSDERKFAKTTTSPRSANNSKKQSKRQKEKKAAAAAAAAAQQEVIRQLASLQLPHMPMEDLKNAAANKKANPPTLRILVVADIDLASASALAESALAAASGSNDNLKNINGNRSNESDSNEKQNLLDRVDLCIACGPFCREEDLRHYYQGRQRRRHIQRINNSNTSASYVSQYEQRGFNNSHGYQSSYSHQQTCSSSSPFQQQQYGSNGRRKSQQRQQSYHPLKRSREETAALEGLMTAALSQLESIVCRVVFVPGRTDPLTTISSNPLSASSANGMNHYNNLFGRSSSPQPYTRERRLTPNSRNIHQQWMPLCPGLGCAGLLYLDWQRLQQPPPLEDEEDDDDDDDESSTSSLLHDDVEEFASSNDRNRRDEDFDASISFGEDSRSNFPDNEGEDDGVAPAAVSSSPSIERAEQTKEYGTEFCKTLERLVQVAPPVSAVTDTPTDSKIDGLLKTTLFQSILVSHFHHLEEDDDEDDEGESVDSDDIYQRHQHECGSQTRDDGTAKSPESHPKRISDSNDRRTSVSSSNASRDDQMEEEEDEESFDPPWPTEHEAFCALPLVQEHVVLEIAAGRNSSGKTVKPMEMPKGKVRVVLPGSLRERGEFCLVDIAFMKDDPYQHQKANDYRWRVRKTRFQTLNEFL